MKLITAVVAVLGLVAVSAADLKSDINAMNLKIGKAMVKGDMKALDAMFNAGMTKDFKYEEGGKTMTYAQMMEQMKASMATMKCTSAVAKLVTLKEKGNSATSTESHVMKGTTMGADKKSHTMSFSGMSTNTYVKVGKDWKMSKM
ncbi:MAG: nuclear transport factor 2 family protein [Armatimonadota bacterium]